MSEERRARKQNVNIRLTCEGVELVDKIAAHEDRSRSQMIRILLSEGAKARAPRIYAASTKGNLA